ncbi:DinB family protein [Chitinophaga sp.]|uniref:DinB family protein n=1 Tax=Chitinophaga sp. TaxID=1869181 RepID=UPI002F942BBB
MMKTIFDPATREELIARINTLNEQSTAQWGKMNIYEMLKHCITYEQMMLGKLRYKRAFIGLLFGKMALKDFVGDDRAIKRNVPTLPQLKVKGANGNVAAETSKWIALLEEYAADDDRKIVHAFFGPLTWEQAGQLVYKHTDHHLRQFNS